MHPALHYASQIAYSSKEVLQFTFDSAVKYRDSPGVYVECGVAAGAQIIAMAAGAPNKTIYAFDSFEGIPLPSNKDDQMPGIRMLTKEEQSKLPNPGEQLLESSGATSVSEADFLFHVYKSGVEVRNIVPVKGWFEDTLLDFVNNSYSFFYEEQAISILRLDGDLYNSTYVCLKYLYPKVIEGGLVIIDDWALPGCRAAVYDYFYQLPSYQSLNSQSLADLSIEIRMKFIEGNDSIVAYWTK